MGFYCDACQRYSTWSPPFAAGDDLCDHCGHRNPPCAAGEVSAEAPVAITSCPHCGNTELYRKKDVPQQLGCAVVLGAIALSTVAYALWDFPGAFAVFATVALLDFSHLSPARERDGLLPLPRRVPPFPRKSRPRRLRHAPRRGVRGRLIPGARFHEPRRALRSLTARWRILRIRRAPVSSSVSEAAGPPLP